MTRPLPGQLGLFGEHALPVLDAVANAIHAPKTAEAKRTLPPGSVRPKTAARAGTVLDHRFTEAVKADGLREHQTHGLIDRRQRVYQCGGEARNFVYQKLGLVTLAGPVWEQVIASVEWLEWIDHELNQCWRITLERASRLMECYEDGIGWRVGIPTWAFDVIDADGVLVTAGRDTKPLRQVRAAKRGPDEPLEPGVREYACGRCWRKRPEDELLIVDVPLGKGYCCEPCFNLEERP